ncbi:hypothetical protein [Paenibacillus illinoisensis]|uniref:Uncharacterized protein n=1 Tax=Paenibacillus illinoisensis TaxID=59845 RepID=A0A2W0C892_9BACL|nr:hypothetical protein [Paenibacillus illinoisensis]PYY28224.1 Uncharacterized protein PIL02S_03370 [Paenibacillus illinoisensis]
MYDLIVKKVLPNGTKADNRFEFHERERQFKIVGVGVIPKGKRKMMYIGDSRLTDNYQYRCLDMEQRSKVEFKAYVEAVGIDTLNDALSEAWERIKPKPISSEEYDIDFDVSQFV